MIDWRKSVVSAELSTREVMKRIEESSLQIALVLDSSDRLLGTVTDGDIRRAILAGSDLNWPIRDIMNMSPTTVDRSEDVNSIRQILRTKQLRHIPIIEDGKVVGLERLDELDIAPPRDNPVILMAGGRGQRLHPLTTNVPKPMLRLSGRPILEYVLLELASQGFRNFFLSVNYLGDQIEAHFGNGSDHGVRIEYLREEAPLGTAGALSLIGERFEVPALVMNADILTKLDFMRLIEAHEKAAPAATVCVRQYEHQIPFGVTVTADNRLLEIVEKPVVRHLVSAGIYVIDADVVNDLIPNRCVDMPDLLAGLVERGKFVQVFPISEYWLDVGRHEDMDRAHKEYKVH